MGRWSRLLAPELLAFTGIRDGDDVLDVGSGTGSLSFAIRAIDPSGRITGVDPAQDFVTGAARITHDPLMRFEVGDARSLGLPDAAFDKTVSALVVNFISEPERAVREMVRVTKPGGVVAAAVWDYGEGMQMLRTFWDEVTVFDPASEPRDERHMPLCRQGELAELWRNEGLTRVQDAALSVPFQFASFDDYWRPFLLGQGPAGAYVANLSEDRRSALEQRLRGRLVGEGADRPIDMLGRAWAVKGTVPPKRGN